MHNEPSEIMDAFGLALRSRDADAIDKLYADDIEIWHGNDNSTQTRGENVFFFRKLFTVVSKFEYKDIRRHAIEGGVVQQHRVVMELDNGKNVPDLHACIIMHARSGKICRIEDYFDASALVALRERLTLTSQ